MERIGFEPVNSGDETSSLQLANLRFRHIDADEKLLHKTITFKLARYYVENQMVPIILRSKKMKPELRLNHLSLRR
jgi:hypothetical protein